MIRYSWATLKWSRVISVYSGVLRRGRRANRYRKDCDPVLYIIQLGYRRQRTIAGGYGRNRQLAGRSEVFLRSESG